MKLLFLASPRFFEIILGIFGCYLIFSWIQRYTLPFVFHILVLFYTSLITVAGIVGLTGLGTSNHHLLRIEHVLESLVRAGVASHTVLLLHPLCSITQSIRQFPILSRILKFLLFLILVACPIDIISIYAKHIPRVVSTTIFIIASCCTITFLLLVVSFNGRIQPNGRSPTPWVCLAIIQLLPIIISILSLSISNDITHWVLEFCLIGWIIGTLSTIPELKSFPPKRWLPTPESLGVRRIPHLSVSEDFQACPDPFAGPLDMGQLPIVISSSFSPPIPKSMAISTWYSKSSRRNSRLRRSRSSASNSSYGPFQFDTMGATIGRVTHDIQLDSDKAPTPNQALNHPPVKIVSKSRHGVAPHFSLEDTDERRPYLSSSSTKWLLSQSDLTSLPSPPPPAHLAPVKSKRSYDPFFPTIPPIPSALRIKSSDVQLRFHSNTDRTPTQSLYHSQSLRSLRSLRSPLGSLDGSTTPKTVIKMTGLYSQINTMDHFDEVGIVNYDDNPGASSARTSSADPNHDQISPKASSDSPNSFNGSSLGKELVGSIPSIPSLPSTYSVDLIYSKPTPSTPSIPSLPSMPSITSIPSLLETPDQTFSSTVIGPGDIPNADDSLATQNSDAHPVPDTRLSSLSSSSNPTTSLHAKLHATTEKDVHNPNGCETIPLRNSLDNRGVTA